MKRKKFSCGSTSVSKFAIRLFFPTLFILFFLTFSLRISDAQASENTPPIANAGKDIIVKKNTPSSASVVLDGSSSNDPDGNNVTLTWFGPFETMTGDLQTVNIQDGSYTISLVANDGQSDSDVDTVNITVASCFKIIDADSQYSWQSRAYEYTIEWPVVTGAEQYDIYRSDVDDPLNFVKVGELAPSSADTETFTESSTEKLGAVYYVVGALEQGEWCFSTPFCLYQRCVYLHIYSLPVTNATAGIEYNYHVRICGYSSEAPGTTFSLVSGPTGMEIDTENGRITWVPSEAGLFEATVKAEHSAFSDTQTFEIEVVEPSPVDQPPTVSLSTSASIIAAGGSATLTWNATNADACAIEPGIGDVAVSGTMRVHPTETTAYTITAKGPGGTATATVTIDVSSHGPGIYYQYDELGRIIQIQRIPAQ